MLDSMRALDFIRAFWSANNVVGAICHASWLLVETGIGALSSCYSKV
ncbi:hypothetical protein [Mesorhizobium sp. ORS 3428]|nr:hypothetical protein [Mesorhizobium sp. ORS 3428]